MYTKIKQQFSKTTTTYDTNAIAQKEIVNKLFSLITNYLNANIYNNILEFGCGTGNLSKLLTNLKTDVITLNDLYNNNLNIIKQKINKPFEYISGDINREIEELIKNNKTYNIVASTSTFQWIESPSTLLEKLYKILSPNGLLAISTFSPDNLLQIKQTLNIGLNYPSLTELQDLFNKYYNILYIKEETINIYFNNTIDVLKHLKLTGVNCLNNTNFTKSKLTEFNNSYKKFITTDNKYELTYKPIYIIATKNNNKMVTIKNLKNPSNKVIFVSGIDTNIGKTIATAILANTYKSMGYNTITQKIIQTGCTNESEDIVKHRELMGIPMQNVDLDKTTCPIILSYPASPHLAAELDNTEIKVQDINNATNKLKSIYDLVLLEGAGGLMVPIKNNYLTIDYIKENNYSVILVTCGKLGSLNHTLLSIDACIKRGIKIETIVYNMYPKSDEIITQNSLKYLKELKIPIVILDEIK